MRAVVVAAVLAVLAGQVAAIVSYCGDPQPIPELTSHESALVDKLVQVQVFIRHGDRTVASPGMCWPNDPVVYNCSLSTLEINSQENQDTEGLSNTFRHRYIPTGEDFPGNCGTGQLTRKGFDQHLANGAFLAQAYIGRAGLLPSWYEDNPQALYLRSDDSRRVIESAEGLFAGMYPSVKNPSAKAQVIPLNIRDEEVDDILPNANNCEALVGAYEAAMASSNYTTLTNDYIDPYLENLAKLLGGPVQTDMGHVMDCFYVHKCTGYPLPSAITPEIFSTGVNLTTKQAETLLMYNGRKVARLGEGPLIGEMWQNMQTMMSNPDTPTKFWLFAGHDTGPIMPFLAAFNIWDFNWAPYASLISVELYSMLAGGYAVRIIYNGDVLHVPGCTNNLCVMSEFQTVVESIVPTAAECNASA